MHRNTLSLAVSILTAALAACTPAVLSTATPAIPTAAPPTAEPPTATPETPSPPTLTFEPLTYRDEVAGYEFDHPSGWTVGPVQQYSRGGITAFTSWERPADTLPEFTPSGETRFDATVQLWDPKGDLEAFLQQRMVAWDASGIRVLSQEDWSLSDGRPGRAFVVEGVDGAQGYYFFTTLGDKYLVLSGDGDLNLLAEIAHTVRPIPLGY